MNNKKNNFIALDLELEQPNNIQREIIDSHLIEEQIIQVGWVVFERYPFNIIKHTKRHVDIKCSLSTFIKNLTKIKDENIKNGTTLDEIYYEIIVDREKYDTSRIICEWGGGDIQTIKKELFPINETISNNWEFGWSGHNVKHTYQFYADLIGINKHCGLSTCCSRLGLKWINVGSPQGKHKADNDAANTAQVFAEIFRKLKER